MVLEVKEVSDILDPIPEGACNSCPEARKARMKQQEQHQAIYNQVLNCVVGTSIAAGI